MIGDPLPATRLPLRATTGYRLRARVLGPRVIDIALRLGLGQRLPEGMRARLVNGGIAYPDVERVLRRIHSLDGWVDAWYDLAQEKERLARQAEDDLRCASAVEFWLAASAAYHFAQFILFNDLQRKREIYARCVTAYAWAAHRLDPPAERVEVPFADALLPGYLRCPRGVERPPVVVNINGANSAKEEFRAWEDRLLARGLATLTLDGPGSGEAWEQVAMIVDYERVGRAVADFLELRADVDPERVGLWGPSLGGMLVLRMAAHDRRFRACVSVSAPYDATAYWDHLLPLTRQQIAHVMKLSGQALREAVAAASVRGLVSLIACPLLVVGGGRDLVVPGEEAKAIYDEATCRKDLWFYPETGHICLDVADLPARMADWLAKELGSNKC